MNTEVKELFLMRHAQTDSNIDGGWPLESDPLNNYGRQQALQAASVVKSIFPDVILSSDSLRAIQTAELISNGWFAKSILHNPLFREIDGGKLKGMSHEEIKRQYPNFADSRGIPKGSLDPIFGTEKIIEFAKRVQSAISYVTNAWPGSKVLIVTHGAFIRMFYELNGIPTFDDEEYLFNCSIAGFKKNSENWTLSFRYNAYTKEVWSSEDFTARI
ncbi:MAG: histidine phosphatase family protein [Thermoplasmatales archaeon]|nr:histidine phosphatase family protein [Thermoplasmatales archaeon]MCW6170239.1 histidine phosphatase family protein [Thermoplasmatales archaeon]